MVRCCHAYQTPCNIFQTMICFPAFIVINTFELLDRQSAICEALNEALQCLPNFELGQKCGAFKDLFTHERLSCLGSLAVCGGTIDSLRVGTRVHYAQEGCVCIVISR